jgi:hypothetical protein
MIVTLGENQQVVQLQAYVPAMKLSFIHEICMAGGRDGRPATAAGATLAESASELV